MLPAFPRHYHWAGLDFIFDAGGSPVLIEANRSSHMLGEYLQFHGDDRPFALTAGVMNRAGGVPCFLWRRGDPFPDADEDACFIARHLRPHLAVEPVICNVEDNQEPRSELVAHDGRQVRPGSIFRWWYGLPWSFERSGVTVINPNCVWVTVRDKLLSYQTLAGAQSFRVPLAFPVATVDEVRHLLAAHPETFASGYVLKPRVGWGGQGVQVAERGDPPREIGPGDLLSERIIPHRPDGRFWEVRVFVMAGVYLGGIRHASHTPLTNYWQGGRPEALDPELSARLEPAALEAVRLLDAAADAIHRQPEAPISDLTNVVY
ncbi:MAG: hypothetical protein EXS05_09705 [Planctomycetaceae bacterium]|nr:hypothetical protein [Planctomycetaceae bacterium]